MIAWLSGHVPAAIAALALAAAGPAPPVRVEGAAAARAESQPRVVLLPRREGDPLPAATDASLRESVRIGLRRGGAGPLEFGTLGVPASECPGERCLARLRALGVRYVVRAALAAVDRDYTLRLERIDTGNGAVVGVFDERCALCGLIEARERVAAGAAGLFAPATPAAPPTTRLEVITEPAGALVTLDEAPLGTAPLAATAAVGEHRLRAALAGHVAFDRPVSLRPGEAASLHLSLAPAPERAPRRGLGRAALALGVPLALGGLVLGGLDRAPVPLGCADPDGCRGRLETTWPAVGLTLVGAALTILGAVIVHQARRRARSARAR